MREQDLLLKLDDQSIASLERLTLAMEKLGDALLVVFPLIAKSVVVDKSQPEPPKTVG